MGSGQPVECASVSEALRAIKSNDRIYVHSVAATPLTLLEGTRINFVFQQLIVQMRIAGLAQRAPELKGIEMYHLLHEKIDP